MTARQHRGEVYGTLPQAKSNKAGVVLYERDENRGLWRPFQETIKLGKTTPSPIES